MPAVAATNAISFMSNKGEQHPSAVAAVVLAAGQSRRMGQPKQLIVVDGEALVVRAVHVALQSRAAIVRVVTGAAAAEVSRLLAETFPAQPRLHLVHNGDFTTGQASSVRCGVAALPVEIGAVLYLPTDQPWLSVPLLDGLIAAWRSGTRLAAAAIEGEVRGAPAIFDRALWPALMQLRGDVGARAIFKQYSAEIVPVAATARELRDLDTPADLLSEDSV